MNHKFKVKFFIPEEEGVFETTSGYKFAYSIKKDTDAGLILYLPSGENVKFPFSKNGHIGSLYGLEVSGEGLSDCLYHFYEGDEYFTDPYCRAVYGMEVWGNMSKASSRKTFGKLVSNQYNWNNDTSPNYSYEESIIYGLDIRAFTMHSSSGVKHPGTFEGLCEKIPYLKKLGITAVELLPCYEYEECMHNKRINCWGFQKGFYFSPKASYSSLEQPSLSFKNMVKSLHKSNIEVFMQFYFPDDIPQYQIISILQYWIREYHIDGFRINGNNLPIHFLMDSPVFQETKLWLPEYCTEKLHDLCRDNSLNIAVTSNCYRKNIKSFLKGDDGYMNAFISLMRPYHQNFHTIHFVADYDGYSLFDSVAYEHKHNELNGEDNFDGTDENFSWNCGIEGETKKRSICNLRLKQIKNALMFVFLSQSTPFIFSGDEFGNTRYGNNNVYSQDNETGWIKWSKNNFSKDILLFTKEIIQYRKSNQDIIAKDFTKTKKRNHFDLPDISYHGLEAWKPDFTYSSHVIGIALNDCNKTIYIAVNMHWEDHILALPTLPKGNQWKLIMKSALIESKVFSIEQNQITLPSRSIEVFESETIKKEIK